MPKTILHEVLPALRCFTAFPDPLTDSHQISTGPWGPFLFSFCSPSVSPSNPVKDLGALLTHETTEPHVWLLTYKVKIWKQRKHPSTGKQIKEVYIHVIHGHTHTHMHSQWNISHKETKLLFFCNMDGPREYSVQFSSVTILLVEPQSSPQFTGDFSWKPSLTPQTGFLCCCLSSFGACCCSIAQLCWTLCGPMDCSMLGFPVHYVSEFAQTHIHWVNDAIIIICNK